MLGWYLDAWMLNAMLGVHEEGRTDPWRGVFILPISFRLPSVVHAILAVAGRRRLKHPDLEYRVIRESCKHGVYRGELVAIGMDVHPETKARTGRTACWFSALFAFYFWTFFYSSGLGEMEFTWDPASMVLGRGYCEAVEQKMESLSLHTERAPFSVCDVMRGEGLAPPKLDTHLTQSKSQQR
jgi:hypothetical protein